MLKYVLLMVIYVSIAKVLVLLRTENVKMVYGVSFVVIARSHLSQVPVLSHQAQERTCVYGSVSEKHVG